jgi:hypothetical protein
MRPYATVVRLPAGGYRLNHGNGDAVDVPATFTVTLRDDRQVPIGELRAGIWLVVDQQGQAREYRP